MKDVIALLQNFLQHVHFSILKTFLPQINSHFTQVWLWNTVFKCRCAERSAENSVLVEEI